MKKIKALRFTEQDQEKLDQVVAILSDEYGISDGTGAIRYLLRVFLKNQFISSGVDKEKKPKKRKEIPKEVLDDLEGYREGKWFCPMHQSDANKCGCLENGELQSYLMKHYGLE